MADQKLTELTATTTPADGDILYQVSDPATTPVDRKITWTSIKAFLKTYFDSLYPPKTEASTSATGLAPQATAPAAGLYNYVGITNGETAYTNKALFDATSPSTQAFADTAVVGTATVAARLDHKHAMMAAPTSVSGNAGTVTNATLTTALTVNTGTVTLTGNVANTSALTLAAGASSVSGANTGDQFTAETISTLIGRGSAAGAGAAQEITLGTGLAMSGTTLNASAVAPALAFELDVNNDWQPVATTPNDTYFDLDVNSDVQPTLYNYGEGDGDIMIGADTAIEYTIYALELGLDGNLTPSTITPYNDVFELDANGDFQTTLPSPIYSDNADMIIVESDNSVSSSLDLFASATNSGSVQEATSAQVIAGTAVGSSNARLYVNPATLLTNYTFGDGSDGDVTITGGTTTLIRDMYYNNLTVSSTGLLATDGFRIYVKGTVSGSGTIYAPTGTAGSGVTGGAANGTGALKTTAGVNGAAAVAGVGGGAGSAGTGGSLGSDGTLGGAGGQATNPGGSPGAVGTIVTNSSKLVSCDGIINIIAFTKTGTIIIQRSCGGSGGGQGGGTGVTPTGGAGGGSGASGGIIWLAANTWSGTFVLQALGGAGGDGGNGTSGGGAAGGGGGGAGGNGGLSMVIYGTKTWTGSYYLLGGKGGNGGNPINAGSVGVNGSNGNVGTYFEIQRASIL